MLEEKVLMPLVAAEDFDDVEKFLLMPRDMISVPKIESEILPTPATIRPEMAPLTAPPMTDRPVKPFINAPVIADATTTLCEVDNFIIVLLKLIS